MTSKAARRRAKKRMSDTSLPDIAPTPKRIKKRGKARMMETRGAASVDHSLQVIEARCRRAGVAVTDETIKEAREMWSGCEAGRAMASVTSNREDRLKLWDAIQSIRRVYAAYDREIGAPMRHAQSMRIMLPADEMSADASSPPLDMRGEVEKYSAAKRAWERMKQHIGRYGRLTAQIAEDCVVDDRRCRDANAMVLVLWSVAGE